MNRMDETVLLECRNLSKSYPLRSGFASETQGSLKALDGVSFTMRPGETLAVVGESGCGKSTLAQLILRLLAPSGGSVLYCGKDIATLKGAELQQFRQQVQIVFQDPAASLNPRLSVFDIVAEPLHTHQRLSRPQQGQRVLQLLRQVGLDDSALHRYPRQFSGGQRQRIGIARAIALQPRLLICDEPVAALDLSVRAQVVNLLLDLREQRGLAYLFISHDLNLVQYLAQRVMVMYLGRIVELADARSLYRQPRHPYTQALLSLVPDIDPRRRQRSRFLLSGEPPSPIRLPSGCRFQSRCPYADNRCQRAEPPLKELLQGHRVACWRYA